MIGNGNNKKSMAYVGNIVSFLQFFIERITAGYNVFNYVDKPDFTMNELVTLVGTVLNKRIPTTKVPYWLGMLGGYFFDILSKVKGKKLNISSVRVKKFCATTKFDAAKVLESGFIPPYTIQQGLSNTLAYDFLADNKKDDITFITE
jgi:nucleoside-diphosphate-sugar epimerase